MSQRSFKCKNSRSNFCYVCANYVFKKNQRNITDKIIDLYFKYFGIPLIHADKSWAPDRVCSKCALALSVWSESKIELTFNVPATWREPATHNVCYFCCINVTGYNPNNIKSLKYPDLDCCTPPQQLQRVSPEVEIKPEEAEQTESSFLETGQSSPPTFPPANDLRTQPLLISYGFFCDIVRNVCPSEKPQFLEGCSKFVVFSSHLATYPKSRIGAKILKNFLNKIHPLSTAKISSKYLIYHLFHSLKKT